MCVCIKYTHVYIHFHILFYYGFLQDIEYSSLCYECVIFFIKAYLGGFIKVIDIS